jgi:hypothetical protein
MGVPAVADACGLLETDCAEAEWKTEATGVVSFSDGIKGFGESCGCGAAGRLLDGSGFAEFCASAKDESTAKDNAEISSPANFVWNLVMQNASYQSRKNLIQR